MDVPTICRIAVTATLVLLPYGRSFANESHNTAAQSMYVATDNHNCVSATPISLPSIETSQTLAARGDAARAAALVRKAVSLAERGAYFSSQLDTLSALRIVAHSIDSSQTTRTRGRHLLSGLRALEEAHDFAPHTSPMIEEIVVADITAIHKTPILRLATEQQTINPIDALQQYYAYAQEQLAFAVGNEPVAAQALVILGRLQRFIAEPNRPSDPCAITLFQAALMVDDSNHVAANELGVLLARYGQLHYAKDVLEISAKSASLPETWNNLAVVYGQLGEHAAAEWAKQHVQERANDADFCQHTGTSRVQWVNAETFATSGDANKSALRSRHVQQNIQTEQTASQEEQPRRLGFLDWLKWR